jgi:hypothetical protein
MARPSIFTLLLALGLGLSLGTWAQARMTYDNSPVAAPGSHGHGPGPPWDGHYPGSRRCPLPSSQRHQVAGRRYGRIVSSMMCTPQGHGCS